MTLAAQKKRWFDARRAELLARGMKDAHIAEQIGVKRAYFSQVVNGMNVSDQLVDRMCASLGVKFIGTEQVAEGQTPAMDPALVDAIKEVVAQGKRSNNIMDLLVEEIRSLREQVRSLKAQQAP